MMCLHLRKERFLAHWKNKLVLRADRPFKVLERINDNTYKVDLLGEYDILATFNVWDISPYVEDEELLDLRTNLNRPWEFDAGALGFIDQLKLNPELVNCFGSILILARKDQFRTKLGSMGLSLKMLIYRGVVDSMDRLSISRLSIDYLDIDLQRLVVDFETPNRQPNDRRLFWSIYVAIWWPSMMIVQLPRSMHEFRGSYKVSMHSMLVQCIWS